MTLSCNAEKLLAYLYRELASCDESEVLMVLMDETAAMQSCNIKTHEEYEQAYMELDLKGLFHRGLYTNPDGKITFWHSFGEGNQHG